jgi:amino acid adenylation domain-containing protein
VHLGRSLELLPVLYGIWLAGAAYVVLEPGLPDTLIAYMAADAGIQVVVTGHGGTAGPSGIPDGVTVVALDQLWQAPDGGTDSGTGLAEVPADALAYVCYTSGSTGRPKGVEIEHRALRNFVAWNTQALGLSGGDRDPFLAAPHFDGMVMDTWPALTAGATVVIPEGPLPVGAALQRWLLDQRITVAPLVTPLAESILDLTWPQDCALRAVMTGGEQLGPHPWNTLPFCVWNSYGPTEGTITSTAAPIPRDFPADRLPSIGRPIWNVSVHVLDEQLEPVPAGVTGELFLGGAGLARGYRGQPALTADRFIVHPVTGERLYRTGDFARFQPDGLIHFAGRRDGQVKLRGYRIELGEIEATLARYSGVHQVAVLADEVRGRARRLVAVIVPGTGEQVDADAVREWAGGQLPAYMVPAAIAVRPDPPRTTSGKLDRPALAAMFAELTAGSGQEFEAPQTPTQLALAGIWQDELGVSTPVGLHDNFFTLGGSSLTAVRVVQRVGTQLRATLDVGRFFQNPTVAAVARFVGAAEAADRADPPPDGTVVLLAGDISAPRAIYLIHALPGEVTIYLPLAGQLAGQQAAGAAVYGVRSPAILGEPATPAEGLIARYADDILVSADDRDMVLVGWSLGGVLAHDIARELAARGRPPALLGLLDPPLHEADRLAEDAAKALAATRHLSGVDRAAAVISELGIEDVLALAAPGERAAVARAVVCTTQLLAARRPGVGADLPVLCVRPAADLAASRPPDVVERWFPAPSLLYLDMTHFDLITTSAARDIGCALERELEELDGK